jgi:hypothetical protein
MIAVNIKISRSLKRNRGDLMARKGRMERSPGVGQEGNGTLMIGSAGGVPRAG